MEISDTDLVDIVKTSEKSYEPQLDMQLSDVEARKKREGQIKLSNKLVEMIADRESCNPKEMSELINIERKSQSKEPLSFDDTLFPMLNTLNTIGNKLTGQIREGLEQSIQNDQDKVAFTGLMDKLEESMKSRTDWAPAIKAAAILLPYAYPDTDKDLLDPSCPYKVAWTTIGVGAIQKLLEI